MSSSDEEDVIPLVIDNGSGMCKAGFAGEDNPAVVIPSFVARSPRASEKNDPDEFYVGHVPQSRCHALSVRYPIEHGIITNWEDMEKIWYHTIYNEMKLKPEDHPMFLTEAPFNPKGNREKMAQVFFETFTCPAFYIAWQALLGLYSHMVDIQDSGLVIDSGDGVTHVIPVFEGHTIPSAIIRSEFAGRSLTDYLAKMLNERGYSFATSAEYEIVRDIKEKLSYLSFNYESDLLASFTSLDFNKTYKLPGGQVITVGSERFRCPEALFNPAVLGVSSPGLHEMVHQCIMSCDIDIRQTLYNNIVLSGGNTMFPGIADRLHTEIMSLTGASIPNRVFASPERSSQTWIGGSLMASLSTLPWISRKDYEEYGPSIISRKC